MTIFLWFFFVHESRIDYRSYVVRVEYSSIPSNLVVQRIEPPKIEVTFSGPRHSFYFVNPDRIMVFAKLFYIHEGAMKRDITRSNVTFPDGLSLENTQPHEVTVIVSTQ